MSGWFKKLLAVTLAAAMTIGLTAGVPVKVYADEAEGGKYVSDVFIAYGKTEEEATEWLKENGWEPVEGDFNAGKASFFDDNKVQDQNVAAVMGIKRTDKKDDAITDMAVMNMTGGYSLPDYAELVNQKKDEINEFINRFIVAIEEFRSNYNGEGSEFGKKRADVAYEFLNKFYDGDPEDPDAVNDTGMKIGDLFIEKTRQEGNENGGDLEQIILEGSGAAVIAMETFLALGADKAENTWLERASGLTGEQLSENLPEYVPEAAGQDIAPSAIGQYLGQKYGGTAEVLAKQWGDINDKMTWFEKYNEEQGLWPKDGESEDAYDKRLDKHFKALIDKDENAGQAEQSQYMSARVLYYGLYETPYEGEWGETLGDFFNPADEAYFSPEADSFLPMAAALSPGQRASTNLLSLQMLLMIGLGSGEAFEKTLPDLEEIFGDETELSIYTGVNRAAFRGGVALTSEALMQQNAGNGNAYDQMWNNTGTVAIASYVAVVASVPMIIAGGVLTAKGVKYVNIFEERVVQLQKRVTEWKKRAADWTKHAKGTTGTLAEKYKQNAKSSLEEAGTAQKELDEHTVPSTSGYAGRVLLGIGGALLVAAAVVKGVQLYKYYDRDMTPIPRMIVDESDIVTYLTDEKTGEQLLDENGKQKKNIEFNTYEYYVAAQCNRPEVGEIGDWNDGVKEYSDNDCYDIADLNADMGQEWVALYTVKSRNKGNPVLADSLTLQYGKKDKPEGCTQALHLFTYSNAVDLGDTAWAYNNGKKGVYFFWDADEKAFAKEAASTFGTGQMALAGIGGLILGIAGATLVLNRKRRKENEPEAA